MPPAQNTAVRESERLLEVETPVKRSLAIVFITTLAGGLLPWVAVPVSVWLWQHNILYSWSELPPPPEPAVALVSAGDELRHAVILTERDGIGYECRARMPGAAATADCWQAVPVQGRNGTASLPPRAIEAAFPPGPVREAIESDYFYWGDGKSQRRVLLLQDGTIWESAATVETDWWLVGTGILSLIGAAGGLALGIALGILRGLVIWLRNRRCQEPT